MKRDFHYLTVSSLILFGLSVKAGGSPQNPAADGFLRSAIQATNDQIASVRSGKPLAGTVPTSNNREISAFGAVRIDVPAEFFVERYRDIGDFKASSEVLQIGKSSDPPSPGDLQPLKVDEGELRDLQECREGSCRW